MDTLPYADVLRQLMNEKNLSQQKLADVLGVNQTTVSQWLLGRKKPGYDSIALLYEKFGITPNELFGVH
ncbi:MAG TPA: helix-turn-helix domain-containing protein [Candidatus Borkfalkia avicola]|uniref:Helix-turn-helix domain-containing protein n=1 Tax=Candidatus Borkfalkia avicola TaxID=2838503 RepID=A0A9D2IHN5_9FIRM|nr:helix-turn-helix domain-containing protein [Candidatus Borkfalkia avicola]